MQLDKVKLAMDCGFYSEDNINELYRQDYKFLIAVKTSLLLVQKRLDEVRGVMVSRPYYSSKHSLYYDSSLIDWQYSEEKKRSGTVMKDTRQLYLHLYCNDQKATDDKIAFNKLLDTLEGEILSGKRCQEHEKMYVKYYEINKTRLMEASCTDLAARIPRTMSRTNLRLGKDRPLDKESAKSNVERFKELAFMI